jgi:hypothetical protein
LWKPENKGPSSNLTGSVLWSNFPIHHTASPTSTQVTKHINTVDMMKEFRVF